VTNESAEYNQSIEAAFAAEACSFGTVVGGVVWLYFRRGEALEAMEPDLGGSGLLSLAQKVDGRLQ
jgi:hypothetical protein